MANNKSGLFAEPSTQEVSCGLFGVRFSLTCRTQEAAGRRRGAAPGSGDLGGRAAEGCAGEVSGTGRLRVGGGWGCAE